MSQNEAMLLATAVGTGLVLAGYGATVFTLPRAQLGRGLQRVVAAAAYAVGWLAGKAVATVRLAVAGVVTGYQEGKDL